MPYKKGSKVPSRAILRITLRSNVFEKQCSLGHWTIFPTLLVKGAQKCFAIISENVKHFRTNKLLVLWGNNLVSKKLTNELMGQNVTQYDTLIQLSENFGEFCIFARAKISVVLINNCCGFPAICWTVSPFWIFWHFRKMFKHDQFSSYILLYPSNSLFTWKLSIGKSKRRTQFSGKWALKL